MRKSIIEIEERGKATIASIKSNEIVIVDTTPIKAGLADTLEKRGVHLVIDLSEVEYVDSTGLGMLVAFHSELVKNDGKLYLTSVSSETSKFMKVTGLLHALHVCDSVDEAIQKIEAT